MENRLIELGLGAKAGAIVGVWFDVVGVYIFLQLRKQPNSWAARVWGDRSIALIVSPILFFHSTWMFIGIGMGLLLGLITGRGSPEVHQGFVGAIVILSAIAGVVAMRKAGKFKWWVLSFILVFFLGFGFLLPVWSAQAH